MSTTPKGPKPEEAGTAGRAPRPALDQTFLGVAPALPVPATSPSPGKPATPGGGSAIIAAPMISVSNDRARAPAANPAAAPPVVTAAPAAAPRAPLQGGWQSATAMPRPPGNPEQTMLHGTPPAAWAAPAPAASPPAARPPAAPASPPAAPAARAEPARPTAPVVERAQPAYVPAAGVQHTALASDYLRGARDAALAAAPVRATAPGGAPPAPPALHFHAAPASVPAPPTQPLSSEQPAPTPAVSVHPSSLDARERSAPIAAAPAAFQSAVPGFTSPEALHGPSSTGGGTQASVAPPRLDAPAPAWNAPAMAPVPNAPRGAAASPMAGTMLEAPRSLPARAVAAPSEPPASFATRFEQVPSARGAFSQQGPGAALPIPIDQSAVDWAQPSGNLGAGAAKSAASSPLRLILLAALAVGAIGFAAFGKQLFGSAPPQRTAQAPTLPQERPLPVEPADSPNQAMLSNRPVGGSATSPVAATPPSSAPAMAAVTPSAPAVAAVPTLPPAAHEAAEETTEEATGSADGVAAGTTSEAEAAASAESRLAAQGARHAIAGRYAEALPVYRELARTYSQNTAYTAMAHVLEQKLGLAPGAPAPAHP